MTKDRKDTAIYVAHEDHNPFDPATPEKELLRAILVTAMNDVKKKGEVSRAAREFFLNTEDDYIFSFQSICNHLSVDPKRILIATGLLQRSDPLPQPEQEHQDSGAHKPR